MQLTPYLHFDGTCREAFATYAEILRGTVTMMMTFGESPMAEHVPPGAETRIMHVRLETDRAALMGSDTPPGRHDKPAGMTVSINLADVTEAERIYAALSDGGTVGMPLQQTFWAKRFGMFTDRFGTPWMINCE